MNNIENAIAIVEMEGFTIDEEKKELIKKLVEKANYDDFIRNLKNNKKEVNDNE